jgi:putative copper resistance protein D
MLVHFLLIGALYFWRVLGADPVPQPRRPIVGPTMRRVLELSATIPFHAFFGVAIMMSADLVVHFYAHPPAGWHVSTLADQQTGGGIAWGFTELPTLVVLGIMFWQWQRSDERAAVRSRGRGRDREQAELDAYNARLARLAAHDRPTM